MLSTETFSQSEKMALSENEKANKRKAVKKKFILICVGVVLLLSGYSACFVLQSSINVQAGLGKFLLLVIIP